MPQRLLAKTDFIVKHGIAVCNWIRLFNLMQCRRGKNPFQSAFSELNRVNGQFNWKTKVFPGKWRVLTIVGLVFLSIFLWKCTSQWPDVACSSMIAVEEGSHLVQARTLLSDCSTEFTLFINDFCNKTRCAWKNSLITIYIFLLCTYFKFLKVNGFVNLKVLNLNF